MRRKPDPGPSDEWVKAAWELVGSSTPCGHCGGHHARACPRVKSLEYYAPDHDGTMQVKKVEFWPHGEWPSDEVVFADLLPFPEEES